MKTISFTLLAISATVIVANPGTEKESSGINLRGSASSVQDFQTYIKAQYLDAKNHEFLEDAAEASPGTTCRREGSGCHIYDTVRPCCSGVCNRAKSFTPFGYCASAAAVEKVDKLVDTTEPHQKEEVTVASRIDAQKFLEETEKASLGTNYCRGGGSPCYTYNSHFCCSGVCNRAQSGSPFGYCASTAAVENVNELMDEVDKTRMVAPSTDIVEDQEFLEDTEENLFSPPKCSESGIACYTFGNNACCSGVCKNPPDGSFYGHCA